MLISQKNATRDTLVAPERLASVQAELDLTLRENQRLSSVHRQLLIRYAALKFMIDEAFRKLNDVKHLVGEIVLMFAFHFTTLIPLYRLL